MLEALAAVIKGLGYAAALTAAGTTLARSTLARGLPMPIPSLDRLIRWAGLPLATAISGTALLFFLRLGGDADTETLGAIFLSPLGLALAMQFAGGLWLAFTAHRPIAIVGALLVIIAFGVVGHSATRGVVSSATVVLHVAAAAWWLGGLWALLLAKRRLPERSLPQLVVLFSRQAVWIVAVLLLAALTTAALILDFQFDLARDYDRALLTKLGLTLALLALAGFNKLIVAPRLVSQPAAGSWLRRTVLLELLLFSAIMATTAFVTTYLSPHDANEQPVHHEGQPGARGPVAIIQPWAPAMPSGASTGAGYMTILNNQPVEDRLISASSPWAEQVTLHRSSTIDSVSRMREVDRLSISAKTEIVMAPGGLHLMFTGLYAPFVAGDVVPLTLVFERAGSVAVQLSVQQLGSRPVAEHNH
ncbi:copper chaperone PCu(A)C [Sphingomonas sp. 37zxx]|uniref:copper chaperone PCu(A)C n=1 Tax=Sphingomonas sp. 37zxx TaxID=1550073 RepID=UPI0006897A2A|nr:copper chaperone PCu(A)C [Sphingomonas sp. 37zxx]